MPPSLRCALTTANIIYEPLRGHRHVQAVLARHGPLDTPARLYVARFSNLAPHTHSRTALTPLLPLQAHLDVAVLSHIFCDFLHAFKLYAADSTRAVGHEGLSNRDAMPPHSPPISHLSHLSSRASRYRWATRARW